MSQPDLRTVFKAGQSLEPGWWVYEAQYSYIVAIDRAGQTWTCFWDEVKQRGWMAHAVEPDGWEAQKEWAQANGWKWKEAE